ncbi:MAG TPA: hypothetical protein VI197_10220 [Polyangiaceae bacterium]
MVASRIGSETFRARSSSGTFEVGFSEAWQDALDPELPAEPTLSVRYADSSQGGKRPSAHKLILMGLALGAALQALGYVGAAYLF